MNFEERGCSAELERGELYFKRKYGKRDLGRAFECYKNAAINGSREAQQGLGMMYARGQGVAQDYAQAYAWYKVAVFQNLKGARRKLGIIEAKMSFQQLRRGRWLAQDYYDRFVMQRVK
jgi:TPR repeat protein